MELTRSTFFWAGVVSSATAAGIALWFAWLSGAKTIFFPAIGLASAGLVLWVTALFDLRSSVFRDRFEATYVVDRREREVQKWDVRAERFNIHPLQPTAAAGRADPARFNTDGAVLVRDAMVHSLCSFLLFDIVDWQAHRWETTSWLGKLSMTEIGSKSDNCALVPDNWFVERLKAIGNIFADQPPYGSGAGLRLPPGSRIDLDARRIALVTPLCSVTLTVSEHPVASRPVGSPVEAAGAQEKLANGAPRFSTIAFGIDATLEVPAIRSQHREMETHRAFCTTVMERAKLWVANDFLW